MFREDGRVQGLLEENERLKKENANLEWKYKDGKWHARCDVFLVAFLSMMASVVIARRLFSAPNSQDIAREVVAQIRQNPRSVYDRQWAEYFTERVVVPAYREGVRDAREEFEASRRAETQAQPVLSADGRDLTVPPPSPPELPLNTVVYGRIIGGDGESYIFHAQAGERIVFRMQATVGSALIPVLWLFTEDGSTQLKVSDQDQSRYASFAYTFESTGTYIVFCGYRHHEYANFGSYALSARHH